MRVLIEVYRGWEILFDTDFEEFYTVSSAVDKDMKKKSYASVKKFIDDFIKENSHFKPIVVQDIDGEKLTLIGLRKDGAFMCENNKGEKKQLSAYDEKKYFLSDPRNNEHFERLEELSRLLHRTSLEIEEVKNMVIKETAIDIRKKLLGEVA